MQRALRNDRGHLRLLEPHASRIATSLPRFHLPDLVEEMPTLAVPLTTLREAWSKLFLSVQSSTRTPSVFSTAWHAGLGRCLVSRTPEQLSAVTCTIQQLGALGVLREPHIEDFEGQIRFVWNRDDHYIEVIVYPDGLVGWYHGRPDGSFDGDDGDGLGAKFTQAMEHARP